LVRLTPIPAAKARTASTLVSLGARVESAKGSDRSQLIERLIEVEEAIVAKFSKNPK